MAAAIALDASVIVRYLTGDDKEQSAEAADLFRAAQSGKVKLVIPTATIQETVYALETYYDSEAEDIASKLISLLSLPNVHAPDDRWVIEALQFYRTRNCDFGDALLCASAHSEKWGVATFDKGILKKFPEVETSTPGDWIAGKAKPRSGGQQN